MNEIYTSLEEAGKELQKRRLDFDLIKKVEEELGDKLIPKFKTEPRAVSFRQICTPDNGFNFFYNSASDLKLTPLVLEYHKDIFVHFNEEKKGLGRLRLLLEDSSPVTVDIVNFFENEKKKLDEVVLKDGENLLQFHHKLFTIASYQSIDLFDNSTWFKSFGNAADYYYYLLLHFVCHGVLFETFITDPEDKEGEFTRSIVLPAIQKIKDRFGVVPLVIQQYPDNQTKEEDFFWWCYPEVVNNFLAEYAQSSNLAFKKVSF